MGIGHKKAWAADLGCEALGVDGLVWAGALLGQDMKQQTQPTRRHLWDHSITLACVPQRQWIRSDGPCTDGLMIDQGYPFQACFM
jgi:hypothetical protein